MARFILLDHSLREVGGHHYEYALNVLLAAEQAGLEIVVGTNVDCHSLPDFSDDWLIIPTFQLTAYSEFSVSRGFGDPAADRLARLSRPIPLWRRIWNSLRGACDPRRISRTFRRAARAKSRQISDRWPVILAYAQECEQFFKQIQWECDDIVFVPTLTEFDLERLVRFLSTQPKSRQATWHLHFHFNYLDGRESDYAEQAGRLQAMQVYFQDLLAQIPHHKVFLYTTTEQLARQYDHLEVAHFQPLNYPVNESIRPILRDQSPAGLRVTTAGCIRPEKGFPFYESLIRELWRDFFRTGRLQLVVQSDQKDIELTLPDGSQPTFTTHVQEVDQLQASVVGIRAPLSVEEYVRLIQSTDIGLFLYDSMRYYSRCSGVLVEMLAGGVPVIVPPGCWLSEQIAEAVYGHRDQLIRDVPALQVVSLRDVRIQPRSGEDPTCIAELPVPQSATHLVVVAHPAQPSRQEEYVRITAEAMDSASEPLKPFSEIIGSRSNGKPSSAMIPLRANSARIRLSLASAYGAGDLQIADAQFYFFSDSSVPGGIPLGSVGLIAEGPDQIADLLKDMTTCYSHYRHSACEFSRQWRHDHHPQRTVEALLANSREPRKKTTSVTRKAA